MKRYLITGGTGFIGQYLVPEVQRCDSVLLLGRNADSSVNPCFECDLASGEIPEHAFQGVVGVFHLAGIAHTGFGEYASSYYTQINVSATKSLLDLAVRSGCEKFVYLSSVQARDCSQNTYRCGEDDGMPARSAYGRSKFEAEQTVMQYSDRIGTCILRPALVYGPGVKGNLSSMVGQIHRKRFPPIPEFGGHRSMVCVDDVVQAAVLAMQNPRANGKTYILADGVDYTTRKIYEAITHAFEYEVPGWTVPEFILKGCAKLGDFIQKVGGKRVPFNSEVLSKLAGNASYSAEKIKQELGWTPRFTFYDKVADIVSTYTKQR